MALQLDEIYHTHSMLKFMRKQGMNQLCLELCELMLAKNPQDTLACELQLTIKEELRQQFQRFVNNNPRRKKEEIYQEKLEAYQSALHKQQQVLQADGQKIGSLA